MHGWNKCCSDSPADTERAEFLKRTINKETCAATVAMTKCKPMKKKIIRK